MSGKGNQNLSSKKGTTKQSNIYTQYGYGKSKSPKKAVEETPIYIFNTCKKILEKQTAEEVNRWLIENKISSSLLKGEKLKFILNTTRRIYQEMIVNCQKDGQQYINKVIEHLQNSNQKSYEFFRCLKYFAFKDAEFAFIADAALNRNVQPLSFYLRCHDTIVNSSLNKNKRQNMAGVIGTQEQWFKIYKKIYSREQGGSLKEPELVQMFLETIKRHHFDIKSTKIQEYNGSQIFRVCQFSYSQVMEQQSYEERERESYYGDNEALFDRRTSSQEQGVGPKKKIDERKVKRLFDKNMIDGLDSEDKELIRVLSFRDQNIAKLLDKKHDKMIEMIADEVEDLRTDIQKEKQKHIEMEQKKQQLVNASQNINNLVLDYMLDQNIESEKKLLKLIEAFSVAHCNRRNLDKIKKIEDERRRLRLIQIIEAEERQID